MKKPTPLLLKFRNEFINEGGGLVSAAGDALQKVEHCEGRNKGNRAEQHAVHLLTAQLVVQLLWAVYKMHTWYFEKWQVRILWIAFFNYFNLKEVQTLVASNCKLKIPFITSRNFILWLFLLKTHPWTHPEYPWRSLCRPGLCRESPERYLWWHISGNCPDSPGLIWKFHKLFSSEHGCTQIYVHFWFRRNTLSLPEFG